MLWQRGEETATATPLLAPQRTRRLEPPRPPPPRRPGARITFQQSPLPADPGKLKCWG